MSAFHRVLQRARHTAREREQHACSRSGIVPHARSRGSSRNRGAGARKGGGTSTCLKLCRCTRGPAKPWQQGTRLRRVPSLGGVWRTAGSQLAQTTKVMWLQRRGKGTGMSVCLLWSSATAVHEDSLPASRLTALPQDGCKHRCRSSKAPVPCGAQGRREHGACHRSGAARPTGESASRRRRAASRRAERRSAKAGAQQAGGGRRSGPSPQDVKLVAGLGGGQVLLHSLAGGWVSGVGVQHVDALGEPAGRTGRAGRQAGLGSGGLRGHSGGTAGGGDVVGCRAAALVRGAAAGACQAQACAASCSFWHFACASTCA